MKIKVCGMRQPENIQALAQLDIDFIGFIFFKDSPRFIGDELLPWLQENQEVLAGIQRVGVTVNAEIDQVLNWVHDYELDYVQLHGFESPEYCAEIISFWDASTVRRAKLVKAFSVDESFDFQQIKAYEPLCEFFVFDTKGASFGGNGTSFDWSLLEQYQGHTPFLLSGGIGPDSAEVVSTFKHPQMLGIDLNSKFEIEVGLKDIDGLKLFLFELSKLKNA